MDSNEEPPHVLYSLYYNKAQTRVSEGSPSRRNLKRESDLPPAPCLALSTSGVMVVDSCSYRSYHDPPTNSVARTNPFGTLGAAYAQRGSVVSWVRVADIRCRSALLYI